MFGNWWNTTYYIATELNFNCQRILDTGSYKLLKVEDSQWGFYLFIFYKTYLIKISKNNSFKNRLSRTAISQRMFYISNFFLSRVDQSVWFQFWLYIFDKQIAMYMSQLACRGLYHLVSYDSFLFFLCMDDIHLSLCLPFPLYAVMKALALFSHTL